MLNAYQHGSSAYLAGPKHVFITLIKQLPALQILVS